MLRSRWGGSTGGGGCSGQTLTLADAGAGPGGGAAEAAGGHSVADHVLVGLEEDDVQLGSEEAAEHHRAAEADRHAHGGGLHLRWEAEGESVPKARPGTGGPAHAAGEAVGEAVSICWALAHLPSPEGCPGRSGTVPALAPVARLSGRTCRAACAWARVWGCGYDVHACQRTHVCVGACVQGVVSTCRCACARMGCMCRWEDVRAHP